MPPNRTTARGRGYTLAETEHLLDIIEEILPEGPNDWARMQEQHALHYPGEERTSDSLKRKFQALYNSRKPTGDPTCPEVVRRAKRAWESIKEKMDFSDGEGDLLERDDDVAEEGEDTEDNAGFNTGVASGEVTGGGNSVSSVGRNSVSPANGTGGGNRTSAGNPIIPTLPPMLRTPRNRRTANQPAASSFSDMMQYLMMRAETESQQRRQEREELEERRRQEREESRREREEARRDREEAEERRDMRIERQIQQQNQVIQMMIMGMLQKNTSHEGEGKGEGKAKK